MPVSANNVLCPCGGRKEAQPPSQRDSRGGCHATVDHEDAADCGDDRLDMADGLSCITCRNGDARQARHLRCHGDRGAPDRPGGEKRFHLSIHGQILSAATPRGGARSAAVMRSPTMPSAGPQWNWCAVSRDCSHVVKVIVRSKEKPRAMTGRGSGHLLFRPECST